MKVGEYVRTDNCIGKVYDICHKEEDYYKFIIENHGTLRICDSDYIIKSSPNIIDLIEVGDILSYKDGSICRIMEITDKGYCLLKDHGGEQYYESKEWLKDIKSIVTKEAFESMKYRIGE